MSIRRLMGKAIQSTAILLIAALTLFFFSGCMEDDSFQQDDAYNELYATIEYKAKQCGQRPPYFLILPGIPTKYEVDLCSITIIRQECPFNDYPIFCLELYGDLPGIGPKE